MHIVPALLPKNFSELEYKAGLINGYTDIIQVDICDGKYSDSQTWPFIQLAETRKPDPHFEALLTEKRGLPFWDTLDYEFDLMVKEPESIIADYVRAGASMLLIHLESTKQMSEILAEWKDAVGIGIAIKPKTPLSELDSFMHEVKHVQFMGNDRIGHAGVVLDERVIDRIREFKTKYPEHTASVDIGVNIETAPSLLAAGADDLVAGSAIFSAPDPVGAIKQFQGLV